jgi:hypothetical protein
VIFSSSNVIAEHERLPNSAHLLGVTLGVIEVDNSRQGRTTVDSRFAADHSAAAAGRLWPRLPGIRKARVGSSNLLVGSPKKWRADTATPER